MSTPETRRVLYIDTEHNCWDGSRPKGAEHEVFQLGVVEVNVRELRITRSTSYLIRTKQALSDRCTALTGMTNDRLRREGRPWPEVTQTLLKEYGPLNKMAFSWGHEAPAFQPMADMYGEFYGNPFRHLTDLGHSTSVMLGLERSLSLPDAMAQFGLTPLTPWHDAQVDATNLAHLHMAMMPMARTHVLTPA